MSQQTRNPAATRIWIRWVGAASACLAAGAWSGCGRPPYESAPVRGTVTIDGRPLSQAKIMFAPVAGGEHANPGKPAFGLLQNDGSFTLTTYENNDGAVVGVHWVTLINTARSTTRTSAENGHRAPPNAPKFTRLAVPQQVTVVAGLENRIDIKLTRQDVAQYAVANDD